MRPLRHFFSGVVENVFYSNLGLCNPRTVDYFANLLCSYIHVDDLFPFGEKGKVKNISQLFSHAKKTEQKRKLCRYVGDFTIFWVSFYPENVKNIHDTGLGFSCSDFAQRGREFYLMSCKYTSSNQNPAPQLLEDLSTHYHDYVQGLALCRQEFS